MKKNKKYLYNNGKRKTSALKIYFYLFCILLIIFMFFVWYFTKLSILYNYLLSLNFITILFYFFDKKISDTEKTRIPEKLFYFLAILGGSISAIFSQFFFHHKTNKKKFQLINLAIILIQIGFFIFYTRVFEIHL